MADCHESPDVVLACDGVKILIVVGDSPLLCVSGSGPELQALLESSAGLVLRRSGPTKGRHLIGTFCVEKLLWLYCITGGLGWLAERLDHKNV